MTARIHVVCLAIVLAIPAVTWASTTYVERSWRNPDAPLSASLMVQVPVTYTGSDGQQHTHYESRWVHTSIQLTTAAPLRTGEVESFRVRAYASGGFSPSITVLLEPEHVYHAYRSDVTTISSFGGSARLLLRHTGRIFNRPPATFADVSVELSTPENPVMLRFRDFAFDENANALTRYAFTIKRAVFLFPDKLVASGQIDAPLNGTPTIVIFPGGPYTDGAHEFFQQGRKYRIRLKVLRSESPYYVNEFSHAATYEFRWRHDGIHDVRRVDHDTNRSSMRKRAFDDLYDD